MSPPSVGSETLPILEGSERGTVEWFRVFPHGATLLVPSGSLQPPTSLKGSINEHLVGAGQEESQFYVSIIVPGIATGNLWGLAFNSVLLPWS